MDRFRKKEKIKNEWVAENQIKIIYWNVVNEDEA